MYVSVSTPDANYTLAPIGTINYLLCGVTQIYLGPKYQNHLIHEHEVVMILNSSSKFRFTKVITMAICPVLLTVLSPVPLPLPLPDPLLFVLPLHAPRFWPRPSCRSYLLWSHCHVRLFIRNWVCTYHDLALTSATSSIRVWQTSNVTLCGSSLFSRAIGLGFSTVLFSSALCGLKLGLFLGRVWWYTWLRFYRWEKNIKNK